MNYYERHIGDYIKNTAHLTLLEHGVYSRLLDVYYTREGPIPDDKVARLVGARTEPETQALQVVLQEFFELRDGAWAQDRCDQDIAAYLSGEPEREVKKANEDNRLKRHRHERAALFKVLTDRGEHAPWNIGIEDLRQRVSALQADTPETPPATQPATATATPATATQTPDTSHQSPEEKNTHTSADKLPPTQVKAVIELYHEVLPEMPRVRLETRDRARAIAKTWSWVFKTRRPDGSTRATTSEEALAWFRDYFERARNNDFLMGRGHRSAEHAGWKCDLDFLLTDKGMKHVIEKTEVAA